MDSPNNLSYNYEDYNDSAMTEMYSTKTALRISLKYIYVTVYSAVMLVGVPLNLLVIVTILCKLDRRGGAMWFLGLAITDLIFCGFLPFPIVSAWNDFNWGFGTILCKMSSYVVFMTMFNTALMLTFMNMNHVLSKLLPCMSCSQNLCSTMLLLSWLLAALLSIPSLLFRAVEFTVNGQVCTDNYENQYPSKITSEGLMRNKAVMYMRLIFGLLLPLAFITICCCLGILKRTKKEEMQYIRISTAVTVAYFVCWVPYHAVSALQLKSISSPDSHTHVLQMLLPATNVVAAMNSCIKPIMYRFMDRSFGLQWMDNYSLIGKAEKKDSLEAAEMNEGAE
ncbi:chemokine-like receptor 1 [Scleropages formosus]|uniref:Chemerin chemokine-like receptor 1 n=1 Tax=Scleropages formosus TaxID=113540 RepID=A0A8C9R7K6_SCLFO|nr:chemokine-like receptor 1 [Scleropages formosus]